MKRIGFVYDRLLDKDYIKETIKKASKHKTKRRGVRRVLRNIDFYTDALYEMLVNDKVELKPTRHRVINDYRKKREITISPFYPNQILDYLLVETTKPIIKKPMYQYCVGNVDKKGIMYGKKVMEKGIKQYRYFIKLYIRHFYQNVQPRLVIKFLEQKIKDKRFINFAAKVINGSDLPIGCYYSQWYSNFFLTNFDHFVKETLKVPFYIRYVDDMVLGSNNKKVLMRYYYQIKSYLFDIGLELKFLPVVRETVNFLGFSFSKEGTRLRHQIFYRLQKTVRKMRKHICSSLIHRIISFFSWLKNIKTGYLYYKNNIWSIIRLGTIKRLVSKGELFYVKNS